VDKNEKPVRFQELFNWMQSIVVVVIFLLGVLTFIGTPLGVHGYSMMPTLDANDRMLVRSIFYAPDRGDVVVLSRRDFEDGTALVKRVVALEGDVVNIDAESGLVYVNDMPLHEPYVSELTRRLGSVSFPFAVPAGHVFVLGDNRNRSMDSRDIEIGAVDEREIIGQVVAVFLPLNRARLLY